MHHIACFLHNSLLLLYLADGPLTILVPLFGEGGVSVLSHSDLVKLEPVRQ